MATSPQRKLQVFVSSTYLDLRSERQAAVTAILENGHIPAGMELFAAGNEEQLEVIRRWIDESDIFMLVLGRRYGSLEPKSGCSYTELEYEYAYSSKKPFFAVVLSEAFVNAKVRAGQSLDEIVERSNPEKLKAFQALVTSRMCKFVDDEKDIRLAVAQSIRELERRHEFAGWISGKDSTATAQVVADLGAATQLAASLQQKNAVLEAKVQRLRGEVTSRGQYNGRTFEELYEVLQAEKVVLTQNGQSQSVDLLSAAYGSKSYLAKGVSSAAIASEWEQQLFHRVASPLAVYGLMEFSKVPNGVHWQRMVLSESGKRFLGQVATMFHARATPVSGGNAPTVATSAPPQSPAGTHSKASRAKPTAKVASVSAADSHKSPAAKRPKR